LRQSLTALPGGHPLRRCRNIIIPLAPEVTFWECTLKKKLYFRNSTVITKEYLPPEIQENELQSLMELVSEIEADRRSARGSISPFSAK
jgi:hypothetical protein